MSRGRRVVRTRLGARIVEGDGVISEIRSRPGPAHRFVDLMGVTVATFAPGPDVLMLGFAGGGVIGPLRAAGWSHPVRAVDLDPHGEALFRELCGEWAGEVEVEIGEAGAWLARRRRHWDLVFDDLSCCDDGVVTKPPLSHETLPGRIAARLRNRGVAVCNVLPVQGLTWRQIEEAVSSPWRRALVVFTDDYENRLVIAGDRLPTAREAGARLRSGLRALGSRMVEQIHVRTLR